jgi:nitroreductase
MSGDLVLDAILSRRSVGRVRPDPVPHETVRELLAAAVRAPNHHLTCPWRFVVLAGDERREIGEAHARAMERARGPLAPEVRQREAARLQRAPVVIACCVASDADPVRGREDRDAVAAAVQNVLLAAHARGLGAMWRTGAMVDAPDVREALGLGRHDAIVAFVYLGWPYQDPSLRRTPRPPLDEIVTWRGW